MATCPAPLPPAGMPSALETREALVQYITMVIFNCSAKHYAVSAGQVSGVSAGPVGWRGARLLGLNVAFSAFSSTPVSGCPTCLRPCSCHPLPPKARQSQRGF